MENYKYSENAELDFDALDNLMEQQENSWEYWFEYSNQRFLELIARILKKNALPKKTLAQRMGVKPSFISKILSEEHNLEFKTMAKLAFALDKYLDFELKDTHHSSLIEGGNLETITFETIPEKTFLSDPEVHVGKLLFPSLQENPKPGKRVVENKAGSAKEPAPQKGHDAHEDLALAA